jgi:tetratricopeptide (TPR) repeat protein
MKLFLFTLLAAATLQAATLPELIAAGDAADAKGNTAAALTAYEQAVALSPTAPLLVKLAKQYGESMVDKKSSADKKAAAEKALSIAQRAVAADSKLADSHLAVAVCYGRLLDLVPAKTKVEYSRKVKQGAETALKLEPNNDLAWHMLGRWHQACSDLDIFTRGIVKLVYGGLPDASYSEAIKCFKKGQALNPKRLCHSVELGISQSKNGEAAAARSTLQAALKLKDTERDDPDTRKRGQACLSELD